MPRLEPGNFCPLLQAQCRGLECAWFNNVRGTHPQTGAEVEEWRCSVALLPFLLITSAQETRGAAGAVESLRNHVAAQGERLLELTAPGGSAHGASRQ